MKKVLFLLLMILVPTIAHSGTASGKLTQVLAHTGGGNGAGVFMFLMDGERTDPPICSTVAGGKAWALSLEKESGRAMYALALSAAAQGKSVFVYGAGNCDSWGDREQPIYMNLVQ